MSKKRMTWRQYKRKKEMLFNSLDEIKAEIEAWHEEISEHPGQGPDKNYLYDQADDIRDDIRSLELTWDRRDWTTQDFSFNNLVAQNID